MKKGALRLISVLLELRQGLQIQVQTCFRLVEINFLISIILGRALLTLGKKIINQSEFHDLDIYYLKLLIRTNCKQRTES